MSEMETDNSTHSDFKVEEDTLSEDNSSIPYMVCEILVAVFAVIGNALVILVFYRERRLRRRTNYYIVSLAIADLLVGLLGIPFAILASMGLPRNLYACLFTVSLLVVLCTISIFCLVAVSVDRYWAILHPMGYSRNVRTKTAIVIIGVCWVSGTLVGFLPLLGWHQGIGTEVTCYFTHVMDYDYLVFLYFATIIAPAILLAGFYAHIYRVVLNQLKKTVAMNPGGCWSRAPAGGGTMLRMLGDARKREVKATKNLSIIVLFFIICWIPLYTINCVQAFCRTCQIPIEFTSFCIVLSHLNSAINPLLYAYHLRDFRAALKSLLCCLLGVKGDVAGTDIQGGRYGSHNTLHHHGVNTPSRNNSLQSMRIQQSQQFTESTAVNSKLNSGSMINTSINTIVSSMSSIATLPLGDDIEEGERKRQRMWTLTEVSSACEDDVAVNPVSNGQLGVEMRSDDTRRRRSNWESGLINSAYIEEGITLDFDEEDDDDVFISEGIATLNVTELNQQNRTSGSMNGINLTQYSALSGKQTFVENIETKFERERNSQSVSSVEGVNNDSETVFENQSERPLITEIDNNNKAIDDHDKTELAKGDSAKKPLIVSSERRNCNSKDEFQNAESSTENSSCDDIYKSNASPYNQKLSPLKMVGEFLFPANNKKIARFKEDETTGSYKEIDSSHEPVCDSDVYQSGKDTENSHKNGCALNKGDNVQNKDILTMTK